MTDRYGVGRLAAACMLVAACGGGESPTQSTNSPAVTVVSGANAADTVDATFPKPLVVQVTGAANGPSVGVVVHFSVGLPTDTARANERVIQIATASGAFADTASATTDAQGHASVSLRAGTVAQQATVSIAAPSGSTTASLTVTPGAAVSISAPLLLPICLVGGTAKYNLVAIDRHRNQITNLTYSIDSTIATVDPDGTVHGRAPGVTLLTTTSGALKNNQTVAIVPSTPVMMSVQTGSQVTLVSMRLDGTQQQQLLPPFAIIPPIVSASVDAAMASDGTLYYSGLDSSAGQIRVHGTDGSDRRLTPASLGTSGEFTPRLSPDGQWIYFLAFSDSTSTTIWRIHPDGTGGEQIGPTTLVSSPIILQYPSVDPNGTALYIEMNNIRQGSMILDRFDLTSRTFAGVGVSSIDGLAYSPARDRFVYSPPAGGLYIRTVATGAEVGFFIQGLPANISWSPWSPDGRLLVYSLDGSIGVMDGTTGRATLVPVPGASIYSAPVWPH